jgi:ribosome-associated toxin RatA of RatAB toxin-antitoxin module
MTGFLVRASCAIAICLALHAHALAERENVGDILVTAQKNGDSVVIDVDFTVPANAEEVWKVLTDFDHLDRFVSNVQSSKIVGRSDGKLLVAQAGRATNGPLSFAFDSIQEFELKPFDEIRSRLISGSMKKLDGVTQLIRRGGETTILYHGVTIPNVWVPPLVGTQFIEAELRDQYREMRNEIMRRKRLEAY